MEIDRKAAKTGAPSCGHAEGRWLLLLADHQNRKRTWYRCALGPAASARRWRRRRPALKAHGQDVVRLAVERHRLGGAHIDLFDELQRLGVEHIDRNFGMPLQEVP